MSSQRSRPTHPRSRHRSRPSPNISGPSAQVSSSDRTPSIWRRSWVSGRSSRDSLRSTDEWSFSADWSHCGSRVCCVLTSVGLVSPLLGLILTSSVLIAYLIALGLRRDVLRRLALPKVVTAWLSSAIDEEEEELEAAIRPPIGRSIDVVVALVALVIVVGASVAMERGASSIGHHFHVADAVVGGVALAAVTSLPNAVAAIHLAAKHRGAAAFSTALTSNNLNVIAGFLIPGAVVGIARSSFAGNLTATVVPGTDGARARRRLCTSRSESACRRRRSSPATCSSSGGS